jgi:DNA polymerase elongation subunit (family B)
MEFKLTKIDPHNCNLEELEKEIQRLKSMKEEYFGLEQSIKVFLNSIYGAVGSSWFECYNVNLAEAVTLQGQDVAKYASRSIDEYFMNVWHTDKKLHAELGITYANKINEKTLTIYQDTDSCFITFEPVLKSCDYSGNQTEFILKIKELRLNAYLKTKFEEYAKKYNTKNIQDLELEKISYSAIMVAKKKYILDLAWKDPNVNFKPQEKIKYVGVEIMQGSTPKFARKVLKEMQKIACEKGKTLLYSEVVKKLKEFKKEYVLQNPEDIAKTQAIGDYEKYVLEDKNQIRLAPKCGMNVRASAIYNNKILNSKWKTKYNIIKTGDKVKYYYSKDENEVFGFLPNCFPYEFAPPVDYDLQYFKTIIEPFNRIMAAMGYDSIPENLIYAKSLF